MNSSLVINLVKTSVVNSLPFIYLTYLYFGIWDNKMLLIPILWFVLYFSGWLEGMSGRTNWITRLWEWYSEKIVFPINRLFLGLM